MCVGADNQVSYVCRAYCFVCGIVSDTVISPCVGSVEKIVDPG